MNTIVNTLHNAAQAAMETIYPAPHTASDLPRKQVVGMEEAERTRRMADYSAPQEQLAQQNAAQVSTFIKAASAKPRNKSLGFKQVTNRLEQQERARLLQSKSELAFRRANAGKVANMIRSLGWPFYNGRFQSGPVYTFADETSLAEDQERTYRLENPLQAQVAKKNAAQVSNAVRWGLPSHHLGSQRGLKGVTRHLEEKERKRQLRDEDGHSKAAHGAFQVAGLIREQGWPLYVAGKNPADSLEDGERLRRLADKDEQELARGHANRVSSLLPSAEANFARRVPAPQLSKETPKMQDDLHDRVDTTQAYEQERNLRLRDPEGQSIARKNAADVAALVAAKPQPEQKQFDPIEQERLNRMHDRPLQLTAMKNARFVSDLIKENRFPTGKPANWSKQMEKERNRRMVDPQQQNRQALARHVSAMVAERPNPQLSSFNPTSERSASLPFAEELLEKRPAVAPTASSSLGATPVSSRPDLPFTEELLEHRPAYGGSLPFTHELLDKKHPAEPSSNTRAPFEQELLHNCPPLNHVEAPVAQPAPNASISAPISFQPLPLSSAVTQVPSIEPLPTYSAPMTSAPMPAPMMSAPMSSVPSMASPMTSAPMPAPMMNTPVAAPVPYVPMATPTTSVPMPSVPSMSAPLPVAPIMQSAPLSSAPMPTYSVPSMAAPLPVAPIVQSAPLSSAPMPTYSVPSMAAPLPVAPIAQSAPLSSAPMPMSSVPSTYAPLPVAPSAQRSAPMSSAPAPMPMTAPVTSAQPYSLLSNIMAPIASRVKPLLRSQSANNVPTPIPSTYSAPMSQAPSVPMYGTPLTRVASFNSAPSTFVPTYAPVVSTQPSVYSSTPAAAHFPEATYYSPAGAHTLTNKQLQRLQRQAERHDRKAEREAKRAQHDAMKAQKLHMRGKDSRAEKKETRAAQHEVAAKNHQQWANELLSKQVPSTSAPYVGFPTM